jgi:putative nucleotidyltransferase with HDIG domain
VIEEAAHISPPDRRRYERILSSVEATSFPVVALKALQLVSSPDTHLADLEKIILMDPSLSAKVLRASNSVFFSRGRTVETIVHAIQLIGMDSMRLIVVLAAAQVLHDTPNRLVKQFWEHSIMVSLLSYTLAEESRLSQKAMASIAGLFHDIGKLSLITAFPKEYEKIVTAVEQGAGSFQSVEDEMLGIDHCSSGYMQAENWNLAREYSATISLHHSSETPQRLPQEWKSMIDVVKVADSIAAFSGAGYKRPVALDEIPCQTIGITTGSLYDILWRTNDMYEDYTRVLLGEPTEEA